MASSEASSASRSNDLDAIKEAAQLGAAGLATAGRIPKAHGVALRSICSDVQKLGQVSPPQLPVPTRGLQTRRCTGELEGSWSRRCEGALPLRGENSGAPAMPLRGEATYEVWPSQGRKACMS